MSEKLTTRIEKALLTFFHRKGTVRLGTLAGKVLLSVTLALTIVSLPKYFGNPEGQQKKVLVELKLKDFIPPGLTK